MGMRTLEEVLADAREDAVRLRRNSCTVEANVIDRLCDEIAEAAVEYLRFVPESNALLRTGWSLKRLRRGFREWETVGHARWRGKEREYRLIVLPQRANPSAAYEAGRRDGRAA